MTNLSDEVRTLVAAQLEIPLHDITDDTPLKDIDSLAMLDLGFALEKRFKLDLFGTEEQSRWNTSDFATVGDICRAIERTQRAQHSHCN